jgi:hypothetical protein
MLKKRKQLTLFIPYNKQIEEIRERFNQIQHSLIAAHITLCREDEIEELDKVIANIKTLHLKEPIFLQLGKPERFDDGKGVTILAKSSKEFDGLRKKVLSGITDSPKQHQAHITLMHPRNSLCTDLVFNQINDYPLPLSLTLDTISLIEQIDGGPWNILAEFQIIN